MPFIFEDFKEIPEDHPNLEEKQHYRALQGSRLTSAASARQQSQTLLARALPSPTENPLSLPSILLITKFIPHTAEGGSMTQLSHTSSSVKITYLILSMFR